MIKCSWNYSAPILCIATKSNMRPLNSFNPLNWIRLYLWLFFQPARLIDFEYQLGEAAAKKRIARTGAWLSITLALLPLFIPLVGVLFGTTPWQGSTESIDAPTSILALSMITWALTGMLGRIDPSNPLNWVAGVALVVAMGGLMAVGVFLMQGALRLFVGGGIAGSLAFGVTGVVVGVVVFVMVGVGASFVAFSIAFSIVFTIALVVALVVAGFVASFVTGFLLFVMAGGTAFGVSFGVAGIGAFIMQFAVMVIMSAGIINRLQSGNLTPAWWQVALGLLAPLSYAVLIAQYWFGVSLP